jgi:general secretion pathway protein G
MKRNKRGFTLLELLVSMTIIAVLTAIGIVSYSSVNKRSRDVKRKSDLEQVRSALEMYRADNGAYPNIGSGFLDAQGLDTDLVDSGYTPQVPDDPSDDNAYYYDAIDTSGVYSSYCICAELETITSGSESTCTVSLPGNCNYGLKSP